MSRHAACRSLYTTSFDLNRGSRGYDIKKLKQLDYEYIHLRKTLTSERDRVERHCWFIFRFEGAGIREDGRTISIPFVRKYFETFLHLPNNVKYFRTKEIVLNTRLEKSNSYFDEEFLVISNQILDNIEYQGESVSTDFLYSHHGNISGEIEFTLYFDRNTANYIPFVQQLNIHDWNINGRLTKAARASALE